MKTNKLKEVIKSIVNEIVKENLDSQSLGVGSEIMYQGKWMRIEQFEDANIAWATDKDGKEYRINPKNIDHVYPRSSTRGGTERLGTNDKQPYELEEKNNMRPTPTKEFRMSLRGRPVTVWYEVDGTEVMIRDVMDDKGRDMHLSDADKMTVQAAAEEETHGEGYDDPSEFREGKNNMKTDKLKEIIKSIIGEILEEGKRKKSKNVVKSKNKNTIKMDEEFPEDKDKEPAAPAAPAPEVPAPAAQAPAPTPAPEVPAAPAPEAPVATAPAPETTPEVKPAVDTAPAAPTAEAPPSTGAPTVDKKKSYKYLLGAMKAMIKNGTITGVSEEEMIPYAQSLSKTLLKSVQGAGLEDLGKAEEPEAEEEPSAEAPAPEAEPAPESPTPEAPADEEPSTDEAPVEEPEEKEELTENKKFKNLIKELVESEIEEYRTKGALGLKNRPSVATVTPKEKMISDIRMFSSHANLDKLDHLSVLMDLGHIQYDENALFRAIQLELDNIEKSSDPMDDQKLGKVYDVLKNNMLIKESTNGKFAFKSSGSRVKTLITNILKKGVKTTIKEGKIELNPMAPNLTQLKLDNGKTLYYSYQTLVAYFDGKILYTSKIDPSTNKSWSTTTSKHISMLMSKWIGPRVMDLVDVPHNKLEAMAFA